MDISSSLVGARLKEHVTEVTWRDTMNYAASVGDNNPHYFDDESEHGIIAPPMFSVALTWPVSERIWEYIETPDFPKEIMATQLHYTEHLMFYRPVRPGDRIKIKGKIAAILPHKVGTQVVIRFDAIDKEGSSVFTEHIGAMMRGVNCSDNGRGADTLPKVPRPQVDGPIIWESAIPIDSLEPFIYDGCTNIFFPIHTSVKFAHAVGLPGRILQGTATLAYAFRELVNKEARGNPFEVKSIFCRFTGMVIPGTTIRVQLIGKESHGGSTDLFFNVLNSEAERAISGGYARLEKSSK